jgi:hypothetical protein
MKDEALAQRCRALKLILTDVAGVAFHVHDGLAVGLAQRAGPADAPLEVRLTAFMVTEARGGHGCLREFVEAILRARGDWEAAAAAFGASLPG